LLLFSLFSLFFSVVHATAPQKVHSTAMKIEKQTKKTNTKRGVTQNEIITTICDDNESEVNRNTHKSKNNKKTGLPRKRCLPPTHQPKT
jgi:hypothetical protein